MLLEATSVLNDGDLRDSVILGNISQDKTSHHAIHPLNATSLHMSHVEAGLLQP